MESIKKEIKLTDLEKEVLLAVYYSDYQYSHDKEDVIDYAVWYLEECDVDMEPGQLSGAISSCVKKGFVGVHNEGEDSTIWLTEEGFNRIEAEGFK